MRRLAVLAMLAAIAGVLLARSRRRRLAPPLEGRAQPPLTASPQQPPAAPAAPAQAPWASVPWTFVEAPAERPELTIRCHQDARLALDRVDVQETPTQVYVTALARREASAAGEPARGPLDVSVALTRPLGERELIATPVDEPDAPPLYP